MRGNDWILATLLGIGLAALFILITITTGCDGGTALRAESWGGEFRSVDDDPQPEYVILDGDFVVGAFAFNVSFTVEMHDDGNGLGQVCLSTKGANLCVELLCVDGTCAPQLGPPP